MEKSSDKLDHAHVAQVKFYLYLLAKNGLEGYAE
jgi:CRISPR-associated exonuclease Cas4